MAYIGKEPANSFISFAKQDFTTSATTSYTLDNAVTNENELALFINFVRQEPTTAYTASGTSLTLTSATSASDDMYCVFLGKAVQTVNPPSGSVGSAQLANSAKNTPAFMARLNGDQTVSDGVETKLEFGTALIDTDSSLDATNYRFLPTVSGKYFISVNVNAHAGGDTFDDLTLKIKKNSSDELRSILIPVVNQNRQMQINASGIIELNGSTDYVEAYINIDNSSGTPIVEGGRDTLFTAYKIIE